MEFFGVSWKNRIYVEFNIVFFMSCPRCQGIDFESWFQRLKDGTRVKIFRCKRCRKKWQDSYRYDRNAEPKPLELKPIRKEVKTVSPFRVREDREPNLFCLDVHGKTLSFKRKDEKFVVLKQTVAF